VSNNHNKPRSFSEQLAGYRAIPVLASLRIVRSENEDMETVASIAGPLTSSRLRWGWGWLLALGIALILLGTVALGDTIVVTVISVLLIGWLLIASGIFHVVHLIRHTEVRSFWNILGTIFDLGAGFYMVVNRRWAR
jgi:uncharacterized membrane protein HdeD (DUF308 family)